MIAFAAGGPLYDGWRPAGPFVLFGVLAGLACLYGLIVRSRITHAEDDAGPRQRPRRLRLALAT